MGTSMLGSAFKALICGRGEDQEAGAAGPVDGKCILQTQGRTRRDLNRQREEN